MQITKTVFSGNLGLIEEEGLDAEASLDAFIWAAESALMDAFPGARIDLRVRDAVGLPPAARVWDDNGNELPDVEEEVEAIVEDIWESSTWYVWTWEAAMPTHVEDGELEGLA